MAAWRPCWLFSCRRTTSIAAYSASLSHHQVDSWGLLLALCLLSFWALALLIGRQVSQSAQCETLLEQYMRFSLRLWPLFICFSVSALTLLVGRQEEHPAGKIWLMMCCCGYLSGAMCRLFACGPADATAFAKPHRLMPHLNPNWFYLSGTWLTQVVLEKRPLNGCCSSVIWALLLSLLSAIVRLSNVW